MRMKQTAKLLALATLTIGALNLGCDDSKTKRGGSEGGTNAGTGGGTGSSATAGGAGVGTGEGTGTGAGTTASNTGVGATAAPGTSGETPPEKSADK